MVVVDVRRREGIVLLLVEAGGDKGKGRFVGMCSLNGEETFWGR